MSNGTYGRKIKNLKIRVDLKLVINKKRHKISHEAQKIFDNDLVVIHKIKTTLTLNKPAYVGILYIRIT